MTDQAERAEPAGLLDPRRDPAPVEVVPATRRHDLLLVCEHAGRAIPARLDGLGLSERELSLHIAYDIGAEAVARRLAARLGCALVVQAFSRLVIDCNRPPLGRQSIPETSDGVAVPGNRGLSEADKRARADEIFAPFARACEAAVAAPGLRAAFSIHSFTPAMGGVPRPWHIGFLHRHPASRGGELAEAFRAQEPELSVADNAPYRIEDETDWFIPRCAEPRGLPHSLIEIRNDAIREAPGQDLWAARLARLLEAFPETPPCP
jgi:predicted N-formylglutamate amidohydrolase